MGLARSIIPKYKKASTSRLPPAKLPIFRSVVSHPPPPYLTGEKANPLSPATGPYQLLFSTSPRPLIPLTMSPINHRLWNPPAADAKGSRVVERDESGRLARFASRFAGIEMEGMEDGYGTEGIKEAEQFAPEADLSFLEGETLQSPTKALGKRDIVGNVKSVKKGKK